MCWVYMNFLLENTLEKEKLCRKCHLYCLFLYIIAQNILKIRGVFLEVRAL